MGQAFVDCNKRTAFASADVILAIAGAPLEFSLPPGQDPLFSILIQCAQGLHNETHLANYLRGGTRKLQVMKSRIVKSEQFSEVWLIFPCLVSVLMSEHQRKCGLELIVHR